MKRLFNDLLFLSVEITMMALGAIMITGIMAIWIITWPLAIIYAIIDHIILFNEARHEHNR